MDTEDIRQWLTTPIILPPFDDAYTLDFAGVWGLCTAPDPRGIVTIASIGSLITYRTLNNMNQTEAANIPESINNQVRDIIVGLHTRIKRQFPTGEALLLWFSYQMLREKRATRSDMAELAALMLRTPIKSDTWRKRVDAHAKRQGWTALELPMGRPKKEKPESKSKVSDQL